MSKSTNFLASTPQDLQDTLTEVNRKMQEQEAQAKASSVGLPYIDLHFFPVDLAVLGIFTEEEARAMAAVPFYKDQKDLRLAVLEPHNPLLLERLAELQTHHRVTLYYISKASFDRTLKFYDKVLRPKLARDETVRITKQQDYKTLLAALQRDAEQKISASEILELLFGAGIFFNSSDIHIEPEEQSIKFRLRIDGVLQEILRLKKSLHHTVITRIKVLAKLKLNVDNQAQDGRLTFYYFNKPIDVRVSLLPSAYGEEAVLRLLGTGAVNLKLADLGLRAEANQVIEKILQRPNGMTITTGPTGSGKTTTLYAFLNELNQPGVKIITLEDPIEYKLEGVIQTPIDHSVDFSFAKALRAVLRQDPDIIMVGEIRDQETAETAMQAALTGHVVLSTLHTNDAAGAIPRLINMGVKPFIIGPALSAVMAQRLVRKICQNCKQSVSLSPMLLERIKLILLKLPNTLSESLPAELKFYHSIGCERCHNLGYSGRIGIYEVLEVTEKIQDLINRQATMTEFKRAAIEQGMVTMVQDGLLKALDGTTDVEEVFRVAGE